MIDERKLTSVLPERQRLTLLYIQQDRIRQYAFDPSAAGVVGVALIWTAFGLLVALMRSTARQTRCRMMAARGAAGSW